MMSRDFGQYATFESSSNNFLYFWSRNMPEETWKSLKSSAEIRMAGGNSTSTLETQHDHVLILTPLKNAADILPTYFTLLDQLTYPADKLSIGFLVSDSTDDTAEVLQRLLDERQRRFKRATVLQRNYHFELAHDQRHDFNVQSARRSVMAKGRCGMKSIRYLWQQFFGARRAFRRRMDTLDRRRPRLVSFHDH
jgi:hypothetical protein